MAGLTNVFFDLDGTLTDSQEGVMKCFQYSLEALGRPHPGQLEVSDCLGPPLRSAFKKLLDSSDETLIEKAVSLYRERYEKVVLVENRVYPGIPELLSHLSENSLRLYVVTTKPKIWADKIVEHFQLERWFSGVFGTQLDGRFDDKAEQVEFILAQLKLDPRVTLIVGDRENDIRAGKLNRLMTVGVTYGYGGSREINEAAPDYICASPAEIRAVAESLY